MNQSSTAFIVSAFGRGFWLAAQLQKSGIQTTLLDVSSQLGQWPSEIWEGPFGFFKSEKLDELMLAALNSSDPWIELNEGFSVWARSEVFDFKSSLIRYKLEKRGFSQEQTEALLNGEVRRLISMKDFTSSWIPALFSQLSSTYYVNAPESLQKNAEIPAAGATFSVRNSTRQGHDQSLEWLKSTGVQVLSKSEIVDLAFQNKNTISGAEIRGEQQGIFRFDQLVWCLNSEETHYLNEKLAKVLFKSQQESSWCWLRYRLQIGPCVEREVLPYSLVLIDDEFAPWTHQNLMIMQRTALDNQFDVWVRLPSVQRFNKDYLTQRGGEILRSIEARLGEAEVKIQTYPQEYYYTYAQLGAPRFPVFEKYVGSEVMASNLRFINAETLKHYGTQFQLSAEQGHFMEIEKWWKAKLLAEQKKKGQSQGENGELR